MAFNQYDPYNNPKLISGKTMQTNTDQVISGRRSSSEAATRPSSLNSQQVCYDDQRGPSPSNGHQQNRGDFMCSPSYHIQGSSSPTGSALLDSPKPKVTKTVTTTVTKKVTTSYPTDLNDLEKSLMEKEATLKRELAYLNQYSNPWSRPKQIRESRKEPLVSKTTQKWVKECPSTPTSRPTSKGPYYRPNIEADLMEKAAKLLKDVEELEQKPLNKQQILIEVGTKRPLTSNTPNENANSIHTAVIKVPTREIDNKSPLPFAYDNFSTLGVRGNIATVGAAPPDTPYPPIFPTIKRTPSPTSGYRNQ